MFPAAARSAVLLAALAAANLPAQEPQQPAPPPGTSSIQVNARLVVLDVVVLDRNNKPVTNLGKSAFTIYEDKAPQTIKNFEPPASHAMPDVGAELVHSAADLPKIGNAPVNILVFDELNTGFHDLAFSREQMEKYLKSLPEVLPVPTLFIAVGNKKLAVLHDYTQSRAELLDSVQKHTVDLDFTAMVAQLNGGRIGKDDGLVQTLGALSQIAESLKGVPGRKNIIWVGKGYNNAADLVNMSESDHDRVLAVLQTVTDRMLAARATLYTIDPDGPVKPDEASIETIDPTQTPGTASVGQPFGDNLGFDNFATTTGGRIITGRNDIAAQVQQVSEEGTEYYTLAYTPTSSDDAARPFRHIVVRVNDPNLHVVTRNGYFAGQPTVSAVTTNPRSKQAADVRFDLMNAARTSLAYTGLHMQALRTKNGFNLAVNATDLKFTPQADGKRISEVTVVAVAFDKKGKIVGQHTAELKEELGPNDVITPTARVGFDFPMLVPAFTDHIRFVMRDAATATLGSTEAKP